MKTPAKANLLNHLGNEEYPSEITLNDVKEFIRIVLYNGKVTESYTDTRITKYKSLAIKTSAAIPPDQDSIVQVILRAHLQVFKWKRCTQLEIKSLPYERFGWNWSNDMQMVVPVWFLGHQLPEDLRSRKGKSAASVNSVDDRDADNECDDDNTGTKKRKRNCNSRKVNSEKVSLKQQSTKPDQLSVDTSKGTENIAHTSDTGNI